MVTNLIAFILKGKNLDEPSTKKLYAKLCSVIGIILNSILVFVKLIAGNISGSAAILADGMNNLSDIIVSIATFFGYCMAGVGAGKHHPFGHGRYEWLMGLVSNLVVILVGWSLAKSSMQKIYFSQEVQFSPFVCCILVFSIAVKFCMYLYNKKGAKIINSTAMMGTAIDSLSDMISTILILLSIVFQHLTNIKIDGWCGLAVSIFIMFSGLKSLAETIERILGETPKSEDLEKIAEIALNYPEVESVGKLFLHDYGFGCIVVSMQIEGDEINSAKLNEIAGELSYQLYKEMGCESAIQIVYRVKNEILEQSFVEHASAIMNEYEETVEIEELKIIKVGKYKNINILINCSRRFQKKEKEILEKLENEFINLSKEYRVVLKLVIAPIKQHN